VVKIEAFRGHEAIIASGLSAGESLVIEGHRTLIDGEPVEVTRGGDGG
jgi:hypothetical protein